jgi:hypothetical protein
MGLRKEWQEGSEIKVQTREIVSNSEITKCYKECRGKAKKYGKIFIWKNSQPDAVLYSIDEYQRLSPVIEYIESLDEKGLENFIESLPGKEGK